MSESEARPRPQPRPSPRPAPACARWRPCKRRWTAVTTAVTALLRPTADAARRRRTEAAVPAMNRLPAGRTEPELDFD